MVHRYCLVTEQDIFRENYKIYKLDVGDTAKDFDDMLYIDDWSAQNGHFFHLWNLSVTEFVLKIANERGCYADQLGIVHLHIHEAVVSLKESGKLPA